MFRTNIAGRMVQAGVAVFLRDAQRCELSCEGAAQIMGRGRVFAKGFSRISAVQASQNRRMATVRA